MEGPEREREIERPGAALYPLSDSDNQGRTDSDSSHSAMVW